jgi:hypothetical protein
VGKERLENVSACAMSGVAQLGLIDIYMEGQECSPDSVCGHKFTSGVG